MSIKIENKALCLHSHLYESKCILSDRVLPISISPIDYARGNGSNNQFAFEPFQITKIKLSSIKCFTPKESCAVKEIPTIKLK
jgi:hypothetical protein